MKLIDEEDEELRCFNCHRNGEETRLVHHHLVPRENGGHDGEQNRIWLCAACERFLHHLWRNKDLARLRKFVFTDPDMLLFAEFVKTQNYKRQASIEAIHEDFKKWKKEEHWYKRQTKGA